MKFYLLLVVAALIAGSVIFLRGVPVYYRIALLPLLLTLSEGVFEFERTEPIRYTNLALHLGVAAFVLFAALPRKNYRKSVLRFFAAGCVAVLLCLFFICRGESEHIFLRAAVHIVAAAGALVFFMEWIRPPFETPPLRTPSFWVGGAVFSYHMLRLAVLAISLIGAGNGAGFPGFDEYSADLTASLVYGLFVLIGVSVSGRHNFEKKS